MVFYTTLWITNLMIHLIGPLSFPGVNWKGYGVRKSIHDDDKTVLTGFNVTIIRHYHLEFKTEQFF